VTASDCIVRNNSAGGGAGGGFGGGIYNTGGGTMTLSNFTIWENFVGAAGSAGGEGGGVFNDSTLTLQVTTVGSNSIAGTSGASWTRRRRRYLQRGHADASEKHGERKLYHSAGSQYYDCSRGRHR